MKAAALDESVEATMPQCHIYIYQWSMQTTLQAHVAVVTG